MEEQVVTLDFKLEEINTILAALQELPYKVSKTLIEKVVSESQAQLSPAEGGA